MKAGVRASEERDLTVTEVAIQRVVIRESLSSRKSGQEEAHKYTNTYTHSYVCIYTHNSHLQSHPSSTSPSIVLIFISLMLVCPSKGNMILYQIQNAIL